MRTGIRCSLAFYEREDIMKNIFVTRETAPLIVLYAQNVTEKLISRAREFQCLALERFVQIRKILLKDTARTGTASPVLSYAQNVTEKLMLRARGFIYSNKLDDNQSELEPAPLIVLYAQNVTEKLIAVVYGEG